MGCIVGLLRGEVGGDGALFGDADTVRSESLFWLDCGKFGHLGQTIDFRFEAIPYSELNIDTDDWCWVKPLTTWKRTCADLDS
nr:hypothetical protein Iba_chr09aCG6180 [Ipomoea batatas]